MVVGHLQRRVSRRLLIFPWAINEKVRVFVERQAISDIAVDPACDSILKSSFSDGCSSAGNDDSPPCSSSGLATPATITNDVTLDASGSRDSNHLDFIIPFPVALDFPELNSPGTLANESALEPSPSRQEVIVEEASTVQETGVIAEVFRHPEVGRAVKPIIKHLLTPVQSLPFHPARENVSIISHESIHSPETSATFDKKASLSPEVPETGQRWWRVVLNGSRTSSVVKSVAATVAHEPKIVLPCPPNQNEKTMYAQTRRLPLYLFGTISFLSVSTGMWFYSISSSMSYWFGAFVGLIQVYLIISYVVGYLGRDFNLEEHRKVLEDHAYPSDKMPSIDVYLPCCHEPLEVLENTYKYVAKLKYTNFKVYVLDDGGLDTVKRLAQGYGFEYISRDNKPYLKKAGNLRYAFSRTEGEFFVVFDADFCPCEGFLEVLLPYMNKYHDVAIVQSPQFFRPSSEQTWVEQGASATQELFYRVVQVNRDRWGASICVGSNALYRRAALVEVGGTAEIGHSEDLHTGFYALARGWKLKYIPLALACGISPSTPRAFFSQQMRWCSGSTTLLTNSDFWKSKLTIVQKMCYLSGMMYYTAAAFTIFLASVPGMMMVWIHPDLVMWYNLAYAFPSLIYSVFVFRLWSRQMYNFNVNFVFVIQQYAYFMAIKDRVFGTTASWVPSGDSKGHASDQRKKGGNNKYRNMRILCALWMYGSASALIVGVTLRILEGHRWWNFLPLLLLDSFNLFTTHRFIFYSK